MGVHGCFIWLAPLVLVAAPVTGQTGKVVGTVSISDGRPAAGTSINVGCGGIAVTRFTDASGSFLIENLPLGECQMTVVTTEFQVVMRRVTVDGDIPARVTVVLPPGAVNTSRSSAGRSAVPNSMALAVNGANENSSSHPLRLSDRWAVQGGFELSEMRRQAASGPTWQTKTGVSYAGPAGIQVMTSVVARRGYALPLAMVEPVGSDTISTNGGPSYLDTRTPVLWDTEVRIRKHVKTRGVQIDFVGEGLNLLNLNRSSTVSRMSPTLTSRTLRFGIVFGF
jgi:hypothetical protein